MQVINHCRSCHGSHLIPLLDLSEQPFANALTESFSAVEKSYPLSLSFCEDCKLVQLNYTADPVALFSNYFWVTSSSSAAQEYAKVFCEQSLAHQTKDIRYILEVASNDGTFLKPFIQKGFPVLGVDPAQNIADIANDNGVPTRAEFFGEEIAQRIVAEKGCPSIVFARNVLAHVSNLHDFVKGLRSCCEEDTVVITEAHYLSSIVDEVHYDSIYHEHLCYYSIYSMSKLLEQQGLYVYDAHKSPINGGSIVVYSKCTRQEKTSRLLDLEKIEAEKGYSQMEKLEEFAGRAFSHRELLNAIVDEKLAQGKRIIGYGASARGSTMLNFCGINHHQLLAMIDQNTLKQNHFTPGTKLEIVSPEQGMNLHPDVILLLAWNFKEEIFKMLRETYGFKGEIILPLPYPPKVEVLD